jgi:predicted O-methyltransferase YrrM
MKPTTPDAVLDLLDASFASAALGAAMELGLFWLLEKQPMDEKEVARELGIPPVRCGYWLQLLTGTGFIDRSPQGYEPSPAARSAILDVYSQDSWALLADEARRRLPGLCDLPLHIRNPRSAWEALGLTPSEYVDEMAGDAERARRFTRMLYEIHQPLADKLAAILELSGVNRLMDLGGGSGVVSMALANRYPELSITVVDIANVCTAGRQIAAENGLMDRITYYPADFIRDNLPCGFDVVMECDVNIYSKELFEKVRDSLNPDGRFVIADKIAPVEGIAPPSRLHWAFESSMMNPEFTFPTRGQIHSLLGQAGFRILSETSLPPASGRCARFTDGFSVIEAGR